MNRPFMEFMRKHYNHVSEQGFNMTVVRAEEQREAPSKAPSTPAGPSASTDYDDEWQTPEPPSSRVCALTLKCVLKHLS